MSAANAPRSPLRAIASGKMSVSDTAIMNPADNATSVSSAATLQRDRHVTAAAPTTLAAAAAIAYAQGAVLTLALGEANRPSGRARRPAPARPRTRGARRANSACERVVAPRVPSP